MVVVLDFHPERSPRSGWDVCYTLAGAQPLLDLSYLTPSVRAKLETVCSQVLFAFPAHSTSFRPSPQVEFLVHIAQKVVQRGSLPIMDPATRARIEGLLGTSVDVLVDDPSVLSLLSHLYNPDWVLDETAFPLDQTFEKPFWKILEPRTPALLPFLTPQVSLEALSGQVAASEHKAESRWVDFLLNAPWQEVPLVVEVDGSQHSSSAELDSFRDDLLLTSRFQVSRVMGPDAVSLSGPLLGSFLDVANDQPQALGIEHQRALEAVLLGPSLTPRMVLLLLGALSRGLLRSSAPWVLEVRDASPLAGSSLIPALNLLSMLDELWDLNVVPATLWVDGTRFSKSESGSFEQSNALPTNPPNVTPLVLLFDGLPPQATLPSSANTVVCRRVYLPLKLPFLPLLDTPPRVFEPTPSTEGLLNELASFIFNYPTLLPGQMGPLVSCLSGRDSVVLLTTGAGKSLIYQLAGLLSPGVVLVVDPITALIDDQCLRLNELGVSRVSGIHHGRIKQSEAFLNDVKSGLSLFVFVTPERMQSQVFRDALSEVSSKRRFGLLVVDEAHCVSEWGHDFRTSYLRLAHSLRRFTSTVNTSPPLLALTGTASPQVLRDVVRELSEDGTPEVFAPKTSRRDNLVMYALSGEPDSASARLAGALSVVVPRLLNVDPFQLGLPKESEEACSGLVFTQHVNGSHGVVATRDLVRRVLPDASVGVYSGSPPRGVGNTSWGEVRTKVASDFKSDKVPLLVTTKAFGMGIDKPNVRFTVHHGFPSSVEAFCQEAGRAGRDGKRSVCVLSSSLPNKELATRLLSPTLSASELGGLFSKVKGEDDLLRQMFFLTGSFPGVSSELSTAVSLSRALLSSGPFAKVVIPRTDSSDVLEKALYRLGMLGVVDDYTVDFGSGSFTVYLSELTNTVLDESLVSFISRTAPGRLASLLPRVLGAPASFPKRVESHLGVLLAVVYEVVFASRVRALAEMYYMVSDSPSPSLLADRVEAYLSTGPVHSALGEVLAMDNLDLEKALALLDAAPLGGMEYAFASARHLESFPDNPVALATRALGELLRTDGSTQLARGSLSLAVLSAKRYGLSPSEMAALVDWVACQLSGSSEATPGWWGVLVGAWEDSLFSIDPLRKRLTQRLIVLEGCGLAPTDGLLWLLEDSISRTETSVGSLVAPPSTFGTVSDVSVGSGVTSV